MKVLAAGDPAAIAEAVEMIRDGKVVAIPTDTFYGLAADPLSREAVQRLIEIKQRDEGKGILLLVSSFQMIHRYAESIPEGFERWGVWPGAVTFLFRARGELMPVLTGSSGRIGLRMPLAPTVTSLCETLGHAITGTSANRTGEEPARDVAGLDPIAGGIEAAIDGGRLPSSLPSTIIDLSRAAPALVRAGAVDFQYLLERMPR
ncbi:MAG: threonylcarbamoyl-AMP synthase [Acidobacteria bacterium]|nr:threonylcarbamoyl-AMP synthase [Acidobacteriota bacterium]